MSLNGNGYGFDRDFDVLGYGDSSDGNACGYWGCGTAARTLTTDSYGDPQYMLSGSGEPHGTLQFTGAFADVSWESLRDEYWNGFTVGIVGLAADVNTDTDCDGIDDSIDNCPSDANADQADSDGDGIGDVCDPSLDSDGDGIDNDSDNCPEDANTDQADSDGDGIGDVCDVTDSDGDGIDDDLDNCPEDSNADQADTDGDGFGDACDDDIDGDGVANDDDLCDGTVADAPARGLGNNRWADIDADGEFDTKGKNASGRYFTLEDTAGCSCEQIIDTCGYGEGHVKFGCSHSVMDTWTGLYDEADGALFSCKDE